MLILVTEKNDGQFEASLVSDDSKVSDITREIKESTRYSFVKGRKSLDVTEKYLALDGSCEKFRSMLYGYGRDENLKFTDEQRKIIDEFIESAKSVVDVLR